MAALTNLGSIRLMPAPQIFGTMPDGTQIHPVTLDNGAIRATLLTFGAAIQAIEVPDQSGSRANVVLGLDTLADYVARSPHFGAIPGRYAGRIGGAAFTLDGMRYRLQANDGANTLHGGRVGFGKRPWQLLDYNDSAATMRLTSPDGDAGFPGALEVKATYTVDGPTLRLDLSATTSAPTVLNLTNHAYFNLAGEGSGSALGHHLRIPAEQYLPMHPSSIPTGEYASVDSTPFDFRRRRPVGGRIREDHPQLLATKGYDHSFPIPGSGLRPMAELFDPVSGRLLTVASTQPVIHVYTANMLTGSLAGPSRRTYRQSDAICLEAQHPPDCPNRPEFPSTVLRKGQLWSHTIEFRFTTAQPSGA